MSKPITRLALIVAALIVFAACGQKPGVHNQFGPSGSGELGAGGADAPLGADGEVLPEGSVVGEDGTVSSGGGAAGGGSSGTNRGGSNSGGGGSAAVPGGPADRTGVTDTEIRIGIHAPVTGAAPFPAAAFSAGKDIYWTWSGAPKVDGRTVKIFFEDDHYNPTTAVDRCRKMAEQDKVFLLIGGGGTDQIQACSRYAAQKGIPYLSAGVTQIGLGNLPSYFAVSMTYAQQGPLLWQLIKARPEMGSTDAVAMIYTNTPNFQDARDAFVKAMAPKTLVLERKMSKNPSSSEYQQTATAITQSGAKIVYILTAPVHYIQLATRTGAAGPWYVGVGISHGINEVLGTGCQTSQNGMGKSRFFSPFPGIDAIDSMDANYNKAYREKNGRVGDDLGIALWGLNKTVHEMFKATASDLSRQNFIKTISSATIASGVFPPAQFTPANHFGGKSVHLLKGNCNTRTYETEARFASSF